MTLLLGICGISFVFAGGNDSLQKPNPTPPTSFFYEKQWIDSSSPEIQGIDTSLTGIQRYSPCFFSCQYAGNPGLASQSLVFNPFKKPGWQSGQNNFELSTKRPDEILYYNTRKRFTEISYILGAKGEQLLNLKHSQNINSLWNAGFDVEKINTDGYLFKQATDVTNYDLFTWYHSRNKKYLVFLSFLSNQTSVQENGGIKKDELYDKTNEISMELIPVNLSDAKNKINNKNIHLTQIFNFGKYFSLGDSVKKPIFLPTQRLSHSSSFDRSSYLYLDNNPSAFYNHYYYSPLITKDSIHIDEMKNEIRWALLGRKKDSSFSEIFKMDLFAEHRLIRYSQRDFNSLITNFSSGLQLHGLSNKLSWNAIFIWNFLGYNKGDFTENTDVKYSPNSKNTFGLHLNSQSHSPEYVYNQYYSNNFTWSKLWEKVNIQNLGIFYISRKYNIEIKAEFYSIMNYTYFGADTLPTQFTNQIHFYAIELSKDFKWKALNFNNKVWYQYNDNRNVLTVPRFMDLHSLFWELHLFKKALKAQIGMDLRFFGAWYGDAYMPATRQFYRQNEKKIGKYPLMDVFFNFRIKSANLFLKIENVNAGFPFKNYYLLPHNPYPSRAFKFGIIWRFFD